MFDQVIACTEKDRTLPFSTSNLCEQQQKSRRAQESKCIGAFFFVESNLPETELVKCFNCFRSLSLLHQQTRSKHPRRAMQKYMYNFFEQATSTKHLGHETTGNRKPETGKFIPIGVAFFSHITRTSCSPESERPPGVPLLGHLNGGGVQ